MLTVAPSAAQTIATLVDTAGLPQSAGLRIAPNTQNTDGAALEVRLTEAPIPDDQIVEAGEAHVFVDADLADALNDQTLEAIQQDDGVRFTLSQVD